MTQWSSGLFCVEGQAMRTLVVSVLLAAAVLGACSQNTKQVALRPNEPCPWLVDRDSLRRVRDAENKQRRKKADSAKATPMTAADSAAVQRRADSVVAAIVDRAVAARGPRQEVPRNTPDTAAAVSDSGKANTGSRCEYAGATLSVTNDNWSDMRIYLVRGQGGRMRLGQITSLSSATYHIPAGLLGQQGVVYFIASPVGGPYDYYSPEASIQPGHMYFDLRVDAVIGHSMLSVDVEYKP